MPGPDDTIAHAELEIGDSPLMISDPFPEAGVSPPSALGGTTVGMYLCVEDVPAEEMAERAARAMSGSG